MNDYYFDKNEEVTVHESGVLPHWEQHGKFQFITFRLIDSLPQSKVAELSELRRLFTKKHPLPWDSTVKQDYWKLITPFESYLLDNGYGSCLLKFDDIRKIVSDAIKYADGHRYEVVAFVIMPNHVHLLIRLLGENTVRTVIRSIKSYTTKEINKLTGNRGTVWMKEYFDRIVRTEEHFKHCVNYIRANPINLKSNEFELYLK